MTMAKFRLQPILQLREAERQRCREQLAEANRAEELLEQQARQLDVEIEDMTRRSRSGATGADLKVDQLLDVHRYRVLLETRRDIVQRQAGQVREEAERRRLALVEADREVRVLEKLRQRQHEQLIVDEQHREARILDELVTQRWEYDART